MEAGSQALDHGQAIYAKIRVSSTFATGCGALQEVQVAAEKGPFGGAATSKAVAKLCRASPPLCFSRTPPQNILWMAWSGHKNTGRVQGIVANPSKKVLKQERAWKKALQWMKAEFGFRRCPTFVYQILEVQNDEVVF